MGMKWDDGTVYQQFTEILCPKQYLTTDNCRSWCHVGALHHVASRMLWLLHPVPESCVAKILESSQFFWGELRSWFRVSSTVMQRLKCGSSDGQVPLNKTADRIG